MKKENMKKKIVVLLISFVLALSCIGCGTPYQETEDRIIETDYANGYFTVIKKWSDGGVSYKVVYANDTKVKYLIISGQKEGIAPLYNTDGTLQVYNEE